MKDIDAGLVFRVLCGVAAFYLFFFRHEFVAAGIFAVAAAR